MHKTSDGTVIETPTEARQAEPGSSIFIVLVVSLGLVTIVLGAIYFFFFNT